jgi:GDP-4-dehydro-6-deoxy-D-mannose reductase
MAEARPDVVFQVAGTRRNDVPALLELNVAGTANLLDVVSASPGVRVVVVGSAAEYGRLPDDELPARESTPLQPVTSYGVAKAAQTMLALRPHVDAVVARVFNIAGPGEPTTLVGGAIASQIAEVERTGSPGTIDIGEVEAERDFVDVRDAARALVAIAERGTHGEAYNICSGRAIRVGDVLDKLLSRARVHIDIRVDPGRGAHSDIRRMFGSPVKLVETTGWLSSWTLDETLADLLDSWRVRAVTT